jgi:putative restriction endonuclease
MRKTFVGITDSDWFEFLANRPELTEVNFWQPGGQVLFSALKPGELFLFKLHSPNNYIVGGGFFETSSLLPVSIAWETFGPMNGVPSLEEMRRRIEKYRRKPSRRGEDYQIGNIVLQHVFFFHREAWIPVPSDFSLNIVQGKGYDLDVGTGQELDSALKVAFTGRHVISTQPAVAEGTISRMFSDPTLARRRLGQGAFRFRVTDTYGRRCAVSSEHTLPVLEAAHIKPVGLGGEHQITNGLLLRSDIHRLFDRGYVTITPDLTFRVSKRLDDDWKNGKIYYALDKKPINLPVETACAPDKTLLDWHGQAVFLK